MPVRLLVKFFLALFPYLFPFGPDILAAPLIAVTSSPDILTVGESFTLGATASGLVANANYFAKVRIGTTSATLVKGQTHNPSMSPPDDWLSDSSAWTSFPQITTDASGSWTGFLTGRPSDSAFTNQNIVLLRLRKIDNSTPYDSATVSAQIRAAPTPDPPSAPPTPKITVNIDSNLILGQEFNTGVRLESFDPGRNYYLKLRAGIDTGSLNKGQTGNGSAFYSDNEDWNKFPKITTDSSGSWSGRVVGRVGENKPDGSYIVRVRVHRTDSDTFYDSDNKAVSFSKPPPGVIDEVAATTSIVSPVKTPAKSLADRIASEPALVLGTSSSTPVAQVTKGDLPIAGAHQRNSPWPFVFIVLGGITVLGTTAYTFRKKLEEIGRKEDNNNTTL